MLSHLSWGEGRGVWEEAPLCSPPLIHVEYKVNETFFFLNWHSFISGTF